MNKEGLNLRNRSGKSILVRSKNVFLVDNNRPIRQIMREMRERERMFQRKVEEKEKRALEEKEYERKLHEFNLIEKRVKNRLEVEKRRL